MGISIVGRKCYDRSINRRVAWLARSVEHLTLDIELVSLSPMLGVEMTLKNEMRKQKEM